MIRNTIDVWIGGFDNGRTPAVQQNDINSRIYVCRLWRRFGVPYVLADGARVGVLYRWRRRLGSSEYEAKIIDQSTVEIKVPKEAMRLEGIVTMQLVLHENDEVLHGPEVTFGVLRSIEPDEHESEEPAMMLMALVNEGNALVSQIRDALEKGEFNGKDGTSPVVTLKRVDDGVLITVTDKNGTQSEMIFDGKDGEGSGEINKDQLAAAIEEYFAENPVVTQVSINGESPDENGNFVINVLNDAEIADLSAVLT